MRWRSSDVEALHILEQHNLPVTKIIRVEFDALLWVDKAKHIHTAWLTREPGGVVKVDDVLGLPIERKI